jgi:cell division protein FtsL
MSTRGPQAPAVKGPGPPQKGPGPAKGRGRSQLGLTSRGVLLFLVLFVLAATAVYPLREHIAQQARIDQLRAKQAALQAANQRLERERARLRDPAYIDQLAKQDLQMVEPGEQPWLLTGTPPAGSPAPVAPRPAPRRTWYQRVWHRLTDWAS